MLWLSILLVTMRLCWLREEDVELILWFVEVEIPSTEGSTRVMALQGFSMTSNRVASNRCQVLRCCVICDLVNLLLKQSFSSSRQYCSLSTGDAVESKAHMDGMNVCHGGDEGMDVVHERRADSTRVEQNLHRDGMKVQMR